MKSKKLVMLYLATITFITGGDVHSTQRIVKIDNGDRTDHVTAEDLELAYEKVRLWFPENYPESEWVSTIIHPTI